MLFWKRVEIYCGYSLKDFNELKEALSNKKIVYDYKIVNSFNSSRFGHIGTNPLYDKMYYLYVHHKDFDRAMFYTSNRKMLSQLFSKPSDTATIYYAIRPKVTYTLLLIIGFQLC